MIVKARKGDTLWYYSRLFNVPIRLLADSNPNMQSRNVSEGQEIAIPGYLVHCVKVQKDTTVWKIATKERVSIDALLLLNPEINLRKLTVGHVIQVPCRVTQPVVTGKKEYDYESLIVDMRQLLTIYPFLQHEMIGESVMGKSLPELRIGRGSKNVHVNGSFHGNEWITTPVIMKFVNEYLLALTNGETIRGLRMAPFYENIMLSVVPMVNPDGVNLVLNGPPEEEKYCKMVMKINQRSFDFSGWKANIRGVDLNKQFPANWDTEAERKPDEPAQRDYPGKNSLTEPETVAMAELIRARHFDRIIAFHTQGEVIYWGYQGFEPRESQAIVNEFARVSGYEPIRNVDSYAGYKDWFIRGWKRPGFTVELGKGVNPLQLPQFDKIYQEGLGILLACLYV